ncbi:vacuolar ATP synthase subunit E (V-ATPase E subunit) [Protomyces lactucae-debilis]|uniref:Vacuolar ATP synthase subunit E (V-ATPase E subunit) n=1 Tax=Protomyces lactucae-debilis TaxID=2754530 RepID=A0A1Y2FSF7_PROLT|nr:vacuolar ATP synthase subunit E (V-ATPase E subunit) [Protomyces lactucae-debilis]ORY86942.1 vacuolar ATP synthase subunit E (V-ATPase E subunit) [Protomyces lactucae-debilis]
MNDDQVQSEMRKMVSFIKQEALEKSKEIHIKADEEFAIEKAKLVRTEQSKVDEQHEQRIKKAGMSQQIAKSTVLNKQRLKILAARQAVLDDVFEEARNQLVKIAEDKEQYVKLLENLLLESFLKLMTKEFTVSAREQDYDAVKQAIEKALARYKEQSGIQAKASVDEKKPLAKDIHGGVLVQTNEGKIRVNNTLEERLSLVEAHGLPIVRSALFGESTSRKFFD